MTDVTHLGQGSPVEKLADEINRQRGKQQQPPKDWTSGYAKGVEIARDIAKQRGHRVPDQTTGSNQ